jgi:hypothetical protein
MNDVGQFRFQFHHLGGRELAFEDAVLEMVTPISHRFEDVAKSFIVSDIVCNNVRMAHD